MKRQHSLIFPDNILFIIIFICPYLDSGVWWTVTSFLGPLKLIGSPILCFILSLYLFFYSEFKRQTNKLRTITLLILIAVIWSIIKFLSTCIQIGFTEALIVYRKNYILLPSLYLCMNYISNLTLERISGIFKLMLQLLIPFTILYLIQCMGVQVFSDGGFQMESTSGIEITRNIIGMPPVIPFILSLCLSIFLYTGSRQMLLYVIISIVICICSYTRNLVFTSMIIVFFMLVCHSLKFGLKNKLSIIVFGIFSVLLYVIIFPTSFNFWNDLIVQTFNTELQNNEGTYAFRQNLIKYSIEEVSKNNALWTGFGYVRSAPVGEYDFVLGGDTFVAPIIWCEGVLGLIMRIVPCGYLFYKSSKMFFQNPYGINGMLTIIILISILSQCFNYIQTVIFVKYNYILIPLLMLYAAIRSNKRKFLVVCK